MLTKCGIKQLRTSFIHLRAFLKKQDGRCCGTTEFQNVLWHVVHILQSCFFVKNSDNIYWMVDLTHAWNVDSAVCFLSYSSQDQRCFWCGLHWEIPFTQSTASFWTYTNFGSSLRTGYLIMQNIISIISECCFEIPREKWVPGSEVATRGPWYQVFY